MIDYLQTGELNHIKFVGGHRRTEVERSPMCYSYRYEDGIMIFENKTEYILGYLAYALDVDLLAGVYWGFSAEIKHLHTNVLYRYWAVEYLSLDWSEHEFKFIFHSGWETIDNSIAALITRMVLVYNDTWLQSEEYRVFNNFDNL